MKLKQKTRWRMTFGRKYPAHRAWHKETLETRIHFFRYHHCSVDPQHCNPLIHGAGKSAQSECVRVCPRSKEVCCLPLSTMLTKAPPVLVHQRWERGFKVKVSFLRGTSSWRCKHQRSLRETSLPASSTVTTFWQISARELPRNLLPRKTPSRSIVLVRTSMKGHPLHPGDGGTSLSLDAGGEPTLWLNLPARTRCLV